METIPAKDELFYLENSTHGFSVLRTGSDSWFGLL